MWKWFEALIGANQQSTKTVAALPELWSEEEASRCRIEIDHLVKNFLADCRRRRLRGRVQLSGRRSCRMGFHGHTATSLLLATGEGWVYDDNGFATVAIENTGRWIFVGYYGVQMHNGSIKVEPWVVQGDSNSGYWQEIDQREFAFFRDRGTASPAMALNFVRKAITYWQRR